MFQVFDRFNLNAGQTANFQTQSNIRNILTRITGNEPSRIDGLLKVSGIAANLYLLNPSGILFGPNARLDLGGNFFGSTATGIQFGNQIWNSEANTSINTLNSDPSRLMFGPEISAIVNAGNLSVVAGNTLALLGGSVANTGTLTAPGGQIALVAVPGSTAVQISTAAPQGRSGSVLFDPKEIIIGSANPSLLALPNNPVLETDLFNTSTLYLAPESIFNTQGTVLLAATDRIFISAERSPSLNLGSGNPVTFRAGKEFISSVSLLSQERSIAIESPVIKTQLIDTAIASSLNQSGGSITLQGLDGKRADVIGVTNLITPRQDITVSGDRVDGQFLITSAGTGRVGSTNLGGTVKIQADNFVTLGGALTNGEPIDISSSLTQRNGVIQSGLLVTNGGTVNLKATKINAGSVWTSATGTNATNDTAGDITITA